LTEEKENSSSVFFFRPISMCVSAFSFSSDFFAIWFCLVWCSHYFIFIRCLSQQIYFELL